MYYDWELVGLMLGVKPFCVLYEWDEGFGSVLVGYGPTSNFGDSTVMNVTS